MRLSDEKFDQNSINEIQDLEFEADHRHLVGKSKFFGQENPIESNLSQSNMTQSGFESPNQRTPIGMEFGKTVIKLGVKAQSLIVS